VKKFQILLILMVLGTQGVFSQNQDFTDSLVKSMSDLADFIAEVEAEVAPCIAWRTKRDMSHLQGKFTSILTDEGETLFKELFESTGYHGFHDSYFTSSCDFVSPDSVLHYYYNHIKPVQSDSVSYSSINSSWREDMATAEILGYETSVEEFYKFYNKGKLVMKICIYWEDNAFRKFSVDIIRE